MNKFILIILTLFALSNIVYAQLVRNFDTKVRQYGATDVRIEREHYFNGVNYFICFKYNGNEYRIQSDSPNYLDYQSIPDDLKPYFYDDVQLYEEQQKETRSKLIDLFMVVGIFGIIFSIVLIGVFIKEVYFVVLLFLLIPISLSAQSNRTATLIYGNDTTYLENYAPKPIQEYEHIYTPPPKSFIIDKRDKNDTNTKILIGFLGILSPIAMAFILNELSDYIEEKRKKGEK